MLDRQTLELAHVLFPAARGHARLRGLLALAVATVRGLAMLDTLHPGGERNRRAVGGLPVAARRAVRYGVVVDSVKVSVLS